MKVDTLAHVKNRFSSVLDGLGDEPLLITRNGKVAAVLQALSDDQIEDYLLRNSPKFWELIELRRRQAHSGSVIPFDPVRYGATDAGASTVREKKPHDKTTRRRGRKV